MLFTNNSGYHSVSNSTYNVNRITENFPNSTAYEKNERFDWDKIIYNLKLNGFNEIILKFDEDDNLYFNKEGAIELRHLIFDLLNENMKKQDTINDLIVSNNRLKSQMTDNSFFIKRYEEMVKNLNESLLETKQKLKEQEHFSQSHFLNKSNSRKDCNLSETESISINAVEESRKIIVTRYHNLEKICDEQREEINSLQLKLTKLTATEKARNQRQHEIFYQLRNKAPNCYNALDKRLLDVIESYESKVLQLESHLTFFSNLGFTLPNDDAPLKLFDHNNSNNNNNSNNTAFKYQSKEVEVSNEYKQLIKKLQEEIENIQNEKETIKEKYELLKLESQSKPSIIEMKEVLNKLKAYKRLLEIHNIRPEKEKYIRKYNKMVKLNTLEYPNTISDIEFLPLKTCQKYLTDFCAHLNSNSITEAFRNLSDLLKMNVSYPTYFGICSRLLQLIETPGLLILKTSSQESFLENDSLETRYSQITDVVETWVQQLCSVNQLLSSVEQLKSILFPWKHEMKNLRCGILGVLDLVNELINQCQFDSENNDKIVLTYGHAKGLVEHFQNLFECPNIIGVYSRMNVVYSRYAEMQNVIDSLKKILNIQDQRGLACLVAEVDALDQLVNSKCRKEVEQFGFSKDIEILIEKLERYETFFPEFECLIDDIMLSLGLSSIDEILPRIKALQEGVRLNQ